MDPASPRRSGWLSGLAERPWVSLSLNKGGFKKQKPSGVGPQRARVCEMLSGANHPSSSGTRRQPDQKELFPLYFCALGKICHCLEESEVCKHPGQRMKR